jgi:glycosyltransferase involved in cell wall biosynthesis
MTSPTTRHVSIGVPVFNGEKFLEKALRSLVEQNHVDMEILILDNASSDRTSEICRDFAAQDSRVQYSRNARNVGAGPNFNQAFQRSKGHYFKWAAHDDWISPEYISSCVDALEREPDAVLAYGSTICVDDSGSPIEQIAEEMNHPADSTAAGRLSAIIHSSIGCFEIFGLIKSSALARTDLHRSYYGSDRALLAQLSLLGSFLKLDGPILYNRDHAERSIRLAKASERLAWQDQNSRRGSHFPHWQLTLHYASIIARSAPPTQKATCFAHLVRWIGRRHTAFVLAMDVIQSASPSLGAGISEFAHQLGRPNPGKGSR